MLAAMIAFLTGDNKASLYCKNMLTGQTITETYEVDTNLDGKFDDQDKGQPCDFHVAILTSRASFSCGNAFPAFMQELGAAIIGERSGGGACAIQCMATPDGFWYQMSSHRMYLMSHGDYDTDLGVPLDADLVKLVRSVLPEIRVTAAASADKFVEDRTEKLRLRALGCGICEMEVAAIARTCERNGVRCLSVKCISDTFEGGCGDFVQNVTRSAEKAFWAIRELLKAL